MTKQNKFYALVLETPNSNFLSIQYAENLEDAFDKAREEFLYNNKGSKFGIFKIGLFVVKTLHELTGSRIDEVPTKQKLSDDIKAHITKKMVPEKPHNWEHEQVKEEKPKTVNDLIKEVIKNPELLEKNKKTFTRAELKYIKEQIKKNVNNSSLDNKKHEE